MTEPRRIRTYHEVADPGAEDLVGQIVAQRDRLVKRLAEVRRIVVVASGKGGVGKSAVTANLAAAVGQDGALVGIADADLYGPSMAAMTGAEDQAWIVTDAGVIPATGVEGVRVVSMAHLLDRAAPLEWGAGGGAHAAQAAFDMSALRELLADVAWGALDLLLVDAPPGTDKLARIVEVLPRIDTLLLVTTPSEAARRAVERAATLVRDAVAGEVGVVANMTSYVCPSCGAEEPLYRADGVAVLAQETGLPVWAEIPFDPALAVATDEGRPMAEDTRESRASDAIRTLARRLIKTRAAGDAG